MSVSNSESKSSNQSESSLAKALEHVRSNWIPFNKSIVTLVRQSLSNNVHFDPQKTLSILKQDLGLFTFCLKELLLDPKLRSADQTILPIDLLLACPPHELIKIIDKAEREIFHELEPEAGTPQDRILSIPILSAVVSSAIAPKAELDSQTTYLCAVLRQLGIALVAWNYPSFFAKATKKVGPNCTIEKALYLQLGFSTLALSISLAKSLELSDSIISGMSEANKEIRAQQLRRICKIGEALSRSQEQWMDPAVETVALQGIRQVEELMGESGITDIEQAIAENCALLLERFHDNSDSSDMLDKENSTVKTITIIRYPRS